jgi:glycosyltransferase involved in cell wall biosynthesis
MWFYWVQGIATNKTNPFFRLTNWWLFNQYVKYFAKRSKVTPKAVILSSPPLTIANLIQPLKRTLQTKVLFEVRDLWPESLVELANYNPKHPLIQWLKNLEAKAYRQADYLIGIFPGFTRYLEDHFVEVARKSTYIPQAFDEVQGWADHEDFQYDIGYAGSLSRANDVMTLLMALQILAQRGIEPNAIIIGTGPKEEEVAQEAESLGNVTFIYQWLPHEKVLKYLRECCICYSGLRNLSLYDYGISPVKWLDYWMVKKPILAAFSGKAYSMPIEDFGWQVPAENPQALADQIQTILSLDKETLETKGEQGYQYMLANHNPDRPKADRGGLSANPFCFD